MYKTKLFPAVLAAAFVSTAANAEPFDGPFIGAAVGVTNDDIDQVGLIGEQDDEFVAFSGFVGYDYRLPHNFLVGVEAGAVYTVDDEQPLMGTATTLEFDPQYEINVSGRLGYLVRDDLLVYARGGYANLRATVDNPTVAGPDLNEDFDGWLVGGGVEYAFYDRLSARVEYRYQELSEGDFDIERNQAFVGVSYNF